MPGGSRFSGLHHPVIEVRLVDDLSRMSHQLSDPAEDQRMFRVVLPDLFALLNQFMSHCRYRCRQQSILRVHQLKFLLIRPLRQLLEDIYGSVVVQGHVRSPGDVLQSVELGLELLQLIVDPLEGVFRKFPSGKIHVPPRGLSARSGFRVRREVLPGEFGLRKLGGGLPGEEGGASGRTGSLEVSVPVSPTSG